MEEILVCISKYQQLLRLLDEESYEISHALQGEILEEYRLILEKEKTILKSALNSLSKQLY